MRFIVFSLFLSVPCENVLCLVSRHREYPVKPQKTYSYYNWGNWSPVSGNKRNVIYPGTKWCGPGNIAKDYDDLGYERETDKCCREHDYCPYTIGIGEYKYGLVNYYIATALHCDCDNKFYFCLMKIRTLTSDIIGGIYFNMIDKVCFKYEYPKVRCAKYYPSKTFKKKCEIYQLDTTRKKKYQWFDVPQYPCIFDDFNKK